MEKIKPQLTEKHDFHNRGDWKSETSVRFQSIRILFQKIKNLSIESSSTIVGILIDILMAEAKPVATQNIMFEKLSSSKSVFGPWYNQNSDAREKTGYFLINWFVTMP